MCWSAKYIDGRRMMQRKMMWLPLPEQLTGKNVKEEFQKLLDKTYRPGTWNPAASELKKVTTRSALMGIGVDIGSL